MKHFSKVWEYYLEVCNDNNSFFGMTWPHLRSLLNNAEMTKTYILNPLAPEFIPKTVYSGAQGQHVYMPNQGGTHPAAIPPTWPQGYRGPHPQVQCEPSLNIFLILSTFSIERKQVEENYSHCNLIRLV